MVGVFYLGGPLRVVSAGNGELVAGEVVVGEVVGEVMVGEVMTGTSKSHDESSSPHPPSSGILDVVA